MTDVETTTQETPAVDASVAVETVEITMPTVKTGMVIRLHEKIQDVNAKGEPRERIQIFEGLVMGTRGAGASKTFVIRKESNGYGVEKIFPVSSPAITKIEVVKQYKVRKRKLNFIKDFGRKLREIVVKK